MEECQEIFFKDFSMEPFRSSSWHFYADFFKRSFIGTPLEYALDMPTGITAELLPWFLLGFFKSFLHKFLLEFPREYLLPPTIPLGISPKILLGYSLSFFCVSFNYIWWNSSSNPRPISLWISPEMHLFVYGHSLRISSGIYPRIPLWNCSWNAAGISSVIRYENPLINVAGIPQAIPAWNIPGISGGWLLWTITAKNTIWKCLKNPSKCAWWESFWRYYVSYS